MSENSPDEGRSQVIAKIAKCLDSLRWKDTSEDKEPSALIDAISEDRWDLVELAARKLANQSLPRLHKTRLKEYAEQIAIGLSNIKVYDFTKSDILRYIQEVHPEIYGALPAKDRARSDWLRRVCPNADQQRGRISPKEKRQMEVIILDGIRSEKAGFPYFLGPSDSPNWE